MSNELCSLPLQRLLESSVDNANNYCFFKDDKIENRFEAIDFNFHQGEIFFSETRKAPRSIWRASMGDKTDNEDIVKGVGVVKGKSTVIWDIDLSVTAIILLSHFLCDWSN